MQNAEEEDPEDPVLIYSDVLEKVGSFPMVPEARPDCSIPCCSRGNLLFLPRPRKFLTFLSLLLWGHDGAALALIRVKNHSGMVGGPLGGFSGTIGSSSFACHPSNSPSTPKQIKEATLSLTLTLLQFIRQRRGNLTLFLAGGSESAELARRRGNPAKEHKGGGGCGEELRQGDEEAGVVDCPRPIRDRRRQGRGGGGVVKVQNGRRGHAGRRHENLLFVVPPSVSPAYHNQRAKLVAYAVLKISAQPRREFAAPPAPVSRRCRLERDS